MTAKSNIIGPEDGKPINFLGMVMDWKVTADETRGAFSIVEAYGSAGAEPPLHYHKEVDEFFYLIEAQMTFKVGDEIRRIGNGGFVWIPRATVHGFIIQWNVRGFSSVLSQQVSSECSPARLPR